MRVLVDGDASFVLDIVVVFSKLMDFEVLVFSNVEATTRHIDYGFRLCELGPDSADNEIVAEVVLSDLVITDDNLLALRCLKRGAKVLSNSGHLYSEADFYEDKMGWKMRGKAKSRKDIISKYQDFIAAFFALTGHAAKKEGPGTIHIFRLGFNQDQRISRKRAIAIAAYYGYRFHLYTRKESLAQNNPQYATYLPTSESRRLDLIEGFKAGDIVVTSENYFASQVLRTGAKAINHEGYIFKKQDFYKNKGKEKAPVKTLNRQVLHEGKFFEALMKLAADPKR